VGPRGDFFHPHRLSQFIKLKHRRAPGGVNQNLRIPNQKRAIYQVGVGEGEDKEWENKAKADVLQQLTDDNLSVPWRGRSGWV
jgi:hypothetical protein